MTLSLIHIYLVQLAHIALALIGESEVSFRGETVSAAEAMELFFNQ